MNAEILSFYSEKANENVAECEGIISSLSLHLSIENTYHTQIKSEKQQLVSALKSVLSRSQIIFLCGNIKAASEAVCTLMHSSEKKSSEYSVFAQSSTNSENVLFPENSVVFVDRESKEAAFISKIAGKTIIALPPVSCATSNIIDEYLIPYFSKELRRSLSRVQINLFGISLQEINTVLDIINRKYKVNTTVVYTHGILSITVYSCCKTFSESDNACSNAIAELQRIFGYSIFEIGSRTLASVTVEALRKTALTVATAESCTGGLLSEIITSVSGASQVLELGICAYSNRIKQAAVGVSPQILNTYGAISKETAVALADGIKRLSGAGLGIGITGVAGPSSSEGKPVGTVYVALCDGDRYWIRSLNIPQDSTRDGIREYAVATALDLIRRYCISLPQILSGFCTADKLTVLSSQPSVQFTPAEKSNDTTTEIPKTPIAYEEVDFFTKLEDSIASDDTQAVDSEEDDEYLLEDENDVYIPFKEENKTKLKFTDLFKKLGAFYKSGTKLQCAIKIAFTVFAALLIAFCIILGIFFGNTFRDRSQLKKAQESFALNSTILFDALKSQNEDFKGWLFINNSAVNNPVYQSNNNSYYSNHNMSKQKSRYGTLYFDYRSNLEKSKNLVIYGQNLGDGNMFGSLSDYLSISYLTKHQDITLTLANGTSSYKIFAVLIMNSRTQDDNGYLFEFTKADFANSTSFDIWINEINERNLYISDAKVSYEDSLLTLVTTNNAFDNARLVIIAKKVTPDATQHKFTVNPSPRYPKLWYDNRNLEAVWSAPDKTDSSSQTDSSEESSSEEGVEETPAQNTNTGTGQNKPSGTGNTGNTGNMGNTGNTGNIGTQNQNTNNNTETGGNDAGGENENDSDEENPDTPQEPSKEPEQPENPDNTETPDTPPQDENQNQDNSSDEELQQ